MTALSYVLPFRSASAPTCEFIDYVNGLAADAQVILVDGSDEAVYAAVESRRDASIWHLPPDGDLVTVANGKVRGVLTGLRRASHDAVVIADDDVRYTPQSLRAVVRALDTADVVRPQNYFAPLPWHARLDTARILINRMTGGDWPGTLAVRRSVLVQTGGYDGDVLFENLELVRTVEAAGGRALSLANLFVRRLPPSTRHYWGQRVRQAYDEFARPPRLAAALSVLPLLATLAITHRWAALVMLLIAAPIVVAEGGRRRMGATRVFPLSAALCAPLWVLERGISAWLAVIVRLAAGGIRYNGRRLTIAAHSLRDLKQKHASVRQGRRRDLRAFTDPL